MNIYSLKANLRKTFTLILLSLLSLPAFAGVDLVLNNSDSPDPVTAGGDVTYSLRVENVSTDTDATGVNSVHSIVAGMIYQGFSGPAGVSCSGMTIGQAGPGTVTCTFPDLARDTGAGGGLIDFSMTLRSTASGTYTFGAVAGSTEVDDLPANNTADEPTSVNAGADLSLSKSAPASIASGSSLSYTLSVTNNGPDTASSISIQDPIPAGFEITSLPSGCTQSSGIITCNISGTLANGATINAGPVTGQISAASGSTVTNSASVSITSLAAPQDPIPGNDTATVNTSVTAGSDVNLIKSRDVTGPYFVGDSFNFILTPAYTGDSPASLTLTDTLPANYTVGSVATTQNGWTCGVSGQTVTCTQPAGGVAGANQPLGAVTIPVSINSPGTAVTNTATISAASPIDPVPGNNSASDGGIDLLTPTADLHITKSGPNTAQVVVGVPYSYSLRVGNNGPSEFYGDLVVSDNLPAGLTLNSVSASGWGCTPTPPVSGATTLTCTRTYTAGSPLASGSNAAAINLNVTATATGSINNIAAVTSPNPNVSDPVSGNDSDIVTVTSSLSGDAADIRVVKTVTGPDPVPAGDVLTYRLEIVNDGPVSSSTVVLNDTLGTLINNSVGATGAGYVGESISPGTATGAGCSTATSGSNGRRLTCNFTTIPVCTQGSDCPVITVQVRPGGDGGLRTNTVSIDSFGTGDPDISNNQASASSQVDPRADIQVTKTATPDPATAGQPLTYVVTVRNNGPSRADGVTVTDTLPADLVFNSATPSTGSCTTSPVAGSITGSGNNTVACTLGALNNGAQQTVTISVSPRDVTRSSTLTNSATGSTSTIETDEATKTNNTDSVNTLVNNPSLDLVINKVDSVDPVAVGDTTVYTITVNNSGPSTAEDVVVTDTLPGTASAGRLSFQSVTSSQGNCPAPPPPGTITGTLTCNLGDIPASTSATVTVTMQGVTKNVVTNSASVASTETPLGFETNTANNAVNETTTVITKADMEVVSKTPSADPVNVRDNFNFVIRVRNNTGAGLAEADGVVVTDTLPAGMELTGTPTAAVISGTASSASCTGVAGGTSFNCSLGTVSSGGVVDITLPVQLVSVTSLPQTFTNTASVTSTSFDVNASNDSNSGSVTVNSSSITARVFRDFNDDGIETAGDTGIAGVQVTLTGTSFDGAAVSRTGTTDASGNITFIGVPQSDGSGYTLAEGTVSESNLADGIDTAGTEGGDSATVNDQVSGIVLPANTVANGYLFAEVPVARIGAAKRVLTGPTVNADGTFDTTFRIRVKNLSLETLNSIVVTDTLSGAAPGFGTFVSGGSGASLSNGQYTLLSTPTGSCSGRNSSFDGSGNSTLATIPSLAVNSSCNIDITVRVLPTAPLPPVRPSGGRYENQASVDGAGALSGQTSAGNPLLQDFSDNGSNPDANNNGKGNDANEDDPTPVAPAYTASINLTKSFITNVSVQPDHTVLVPVRLVLTNNGDEPLSAVSLTDPLSTAAGGPFGTLVTGGASATLTNGQYTVQTAPVFSGACANGTLTPGFNGDSGNTELASISAMAIGDSCTVEFSYRFMPNASATYFNQATAAGTGDFTGASATRPGSLFVPYPRAGLAKQVVGASSTQADGTVIVPFSLKVENFGGEVLGSISITDTLSDSPAGSASRFGSFVSGGSSATLAAGQYTIQSPPAFTGACFTGTLNAGFDGDSSPTVATISLLPLNYSCTVAFSLRFRPGAPPLPASYLNQASLSATGLNSGLVTTDLSDDGVNTDANGNGISNEAGENDPTPVSVSFTPRIGVAKNKPSSESINADGTVTVPFRVKVQNFGTEPLVNITLNDTIEGVAPRLGTYVAGGSGATLNNGEYTIESAPAINGACATATLTGGFTGAGANRQIASLGRLEVDESCEFDLTVRFRPTSPLPAGGYTNQADAAATGELSGNPVTDLSEDGNNPDSNANDDPGDDNTPTPINPVYTGSIGIAKALQSGLTVNGDGSYTGSFRLVVENLSNEELDNVTITDTLNGGSPRFGTFVPGGAAAVLAAGQYTVQTAPALVGTCVGGTTTAGFDGNTTTTVASITQLAIGDSCSVEFAFRFVPLAGQIYNNQATAAGTGTFSGGVVTDLSDDGTLPDANSNGNAGDPGENDPTPVPIPRIGVAKSAGALINNGDGTYDVPFTLVVNNAGETPLASVQLTDDLSGFGTYTASSIPLAGEYTVVSGPVVISQVNGANLVPVTAGSFTGSGAGNRLLSAPGSSLPNVGIGTRSSAQVQFTLRFYPVTPGPFNNTAAAAGSSPAGGNVTDDSVDGATPDADANGDPGDDSSPTVVNLSGQAIGVAKSVAGIVQTGPRRFEIPYRMVLANVGSLVTATNVQLTDNLQATFPTAQSISISTPPTVSACSGTVLNANPAFTGTGQNTLLVGNQALQAGESCVITFTTVVDFGTNPLPSAVQNNQAVATSAETPGGTVIASDLSDDGNTPDSDSNGKANDANEDDPTPVSFASGNLAAVSGKVWTDINHDRVDNDGPTSPVAGFIVEVLNSNGQLLGSATTAADGTYTLGGLFPSTPADSNTFYSVRFRDPASGAIFGLPVSRDPTPALNGTIQDGIITALPLAAGVTTLEQSLPLDPSGVVYDSVTRLPLPGATVTLTAGGVAVPGSCVVGGQATETTGASGMYQFLLLNPPPPGCPGDAVYTLQVTAPPGYLPPASVLLPPTAGPHTPPAGGVDPIQAQAVPPTGAQPTTYFFAFNLTLASSANVVNNHIPVDPILGGAIQLSKTTPRRDVVRGDLVPYTITATNTLNATLGNIAVHDQMPAGFKLVTGSAVVNGVKLSPTQTGRRLTWNALTFAPQEVKTIQLMLVVGSGVNEGKYVNQAWAENTIANAAVSNVGSATVRVVPDPLFDCSDLIGKVFDDRNVNGYQDPGEPGLPGVRVVTVRGLLITTDEHGRFHLACADVPNEMNGSNFIMKLDPRSLPSGYRVTTENPRVVRLTRGKMVKLNFGAALHRVVRVDLDRSAFSADGDDLTSVNAQQLDALVETLKQRPSRLRVTYSPGDNEEETDASQRLKVFSSAVRKAWQHCDCDHYELEIETEVVTRRTPREPDAHTGEAK